MSGNHNYIFVLWGKGFDEIVASIFVAELRRRRLLVKVVGIGGPKLPGAYGLELVPDMILDEALGLVGRARCIILPCDYRQLRQLENDPRIPQLLARAAKNQAWLVMEDGGEATLFTEYVKRLSEERVVLYSLGEDSRSSRHRLMSVVESVLE